MKQISLEDKQNKRRELLIIIALFILGVTIRFIISNFSKFTITYGDELRYYGISRSLFLGNGLSFRNADTNYQKILYSIILTPFFVIKDGVHRVSVISFINSFILCSSCIAMKALINV